MSPAAFCIGMTIGITTRPGQNWANIWKPLIDVFGPALGEISNGPSTPTMTAYPASMYTTTSILL
jgi:hypothetical protein